MIRGISIHDKVLQKVVDNFTAREVIKAQQRAERALKTCVDYSARDWYNEYDGISDARAIRESMVYKRGKVKQTKGYAEIEIIAEIDPEKYENYTAHYHIIKWQEKYKAPIDPSYFVWDLQWNQGILGLPEKGQNSKWVNPKFKKAEQSMHNYIWDYVNKKFEKTYNNIIIRK